MNRPWRVTSSENNHTAVILLYGYIYEACASDFVKQIVALQEKHANIDVRINSAGGDVFDGFAIYNAIRQSKAVVNTYVDGCASSMASVVAQAGRKRYISKVGRVMTHKPSSWNGGDSNTLRESAEMLDSVEDMMCAIYAARSGKTPEDCKAAFLNGKDNWFDAEQAISAGLADEIYDAEPLVIPAASEMETWKGYNDMRFAAIFNQNQNIDMELKLSAASRVAIGLPENADQVQFEAALKVVAAKAAQSDQFKREKEEAEQKLRDLQAAAVTAQVEALITGAQTAKKITVEIGNALKADYKENPDGLKKLLDAMPAQTTITSQLDKSGSADDADESAKLVAEWDRLDKSGGLPKLKASNADRYNALFKAKFGSDTK